MAKRNKLKCGIVMPISTYDGCNDTHWTEVKSIIAEAIKSNNEYDVQVNMVSDANDSTIIHKTIIQSLYNSDVVICDVSGRNPNVMFELGLRLAFDKATVIIKDDKTNFSFDTGIIEHLEYPRDLRFHKIVTFKDKLRDKVIATYEKSLEEGYSAFLSNFGEFKVAELNQTTVPVDKMVLDIVSEIQAKVSDISRAVHSQNISRAIHNQNIGRAIHSPRSGPTQLPASILSAMISDAIENYIIKNRIDDCGDLLGNPEFFDEIEKQVEAPKYFATPESFMEALKEVLSQKFVAVTK